MFFQWSAQQARVDSFFNGLPNGSGGGFGFCCNGLPNGPGRIRFSMVRPTGLEGFRFFFQWSAQRVWRGFVFQWSAQRARADSFFNGSPNGSGGVLDFFFNGLPNGSGGVSEQWSAQRARGDSFFNGSPNGSHLGRFGWDLPRRRGACQGGTSGGTQPRLRSVTSWPRGPWQFRCWLRGSGLVGGRAPRAPGGARLRGWPRGPWQGTWGTLGRFWGGPGTSWRRRPWQGT